LLAAEDNSVESGLQLLKRRRPRNALQLERPSMEAFSPSSTSERLDREDTPGLLIYNTYRIKEKLLYSLASDPNTFSL
jgi:hypothetical protein